MKLSHLAFVVLLLALAVLAASASEALQPDQQEEPVIEEELPEVEPEQPKGPDVVYERVQYNHNHIRQPGHNPPNTHNDVLSDMPLRDPTDIHELATRQLQQLHPPEPFKKVRLRIPLQLTSVHGCPQSSSPRHTTSGCRLDGSTRITIRGKGFQSCLGSVRGSSAWLAEAGPVGNVAKPLTASSSDASEGPSIPLLRFPCNNLEFSTLLPDLVAYCTLPSFESHPDLARQLSTIFRNVSHTKFNFQVFSGDLTQSAMLANAVTFSRKAITIQGEGDAPDDSRSSAGGDEREDETDELLDGTLLTAVETGNWKALGIGGVDKQFTELYRRALSTRSAKTSELVSAIGIDHIKGVILHGPPGTGKTLAARMLAKLLHAKDVTIVNGPEIMSKFVGDSEKNLRELFSPALAEFKKKKEKAGLYVIVFDEVDAILRPRGQGEESGAKALYDGVTTQLLSYMDGVHSAPNILVVGLTNRLDALDKALLRPGRFEVQIRMHLPDKSGREEILWVHSQTLRDKGFLASDVNLVQIAEDMTSFSGADIAGAVRSAISFALERHTKKSSDIDQSTCPDGVTGQSSSCSGKSVPTVKPLSPEEAQAQLLSENEDVAPPAPVNVDNTFKVKMADFRRAIKEVLAARSSGSGLESFMNRGVVPYSKSIPSILSNIQKLADALLKLTGSSSSSKGRSASPRVARYGIMGPRGSGKSTIAALAARNARFASSFVISPEMLIGMTHAEKIRRINEVFDTAAHTPSAVVLIDDCDSIIELVGGNGNLNIVVALRALIHRDLTKIASREGSGDGTLLIITTSTSEEVFQHLGLYQFDGHAMLADLSRGAAAAVLQAYHVFGEGAKQLCIEAARNLPPRIPIKRLMFFIDQCRAMSDVDLQALKMPTNDLTEHKLFHSLWSNGSDDEDEGKTFDPFAKQQQSQEQPASFVTVEQFHSLLAQYHSFYSSSNIDFVVEDLTPA